MTASQGRVLTNIWTSAKDREGVELWRVWKGSDLYCCLWPMGGSISGNRSDPPDHGPYVPVNGYHGVNGND